jgi:hypothetical protein
MRANAYIRKWHDERAEEIKTLCAKGVVPIEHDFENGSEEIDLPHLMGQVAGLVDKVQPAKEIVDDMVKEAVDMLQLGNTYLSGKSRL